jgi:cytochrome c553
VSRRQQKIKRTLVAEAGGRCVVCGYDRCLWNLHFHHIEPSTKSFSMSMASGKSLAAYREEAQKCILVCAICHGEIEAGTVPRRGGPARLPAAEIVRRLAEDAAADLSRQ